MIQYLTAWAKLYDIGCVDSWIRTIPDKLCRGKMLGSIGCSVVLRPDTFLELQTGLPLGVVLLVADILEEESTFTSLFAIWNGVIDFS